MVWSDFSVKPAWSPLTIDAICESLYKKVKKENDFGIVGDDVGVGVEDVPVVGVVDSDGAGIVDGEVAGVGDVYVLI